MKISNILFIAVVMIVSIVLVHAESGSIIISDDVVKNYVWSTDIAGLNAPTWTTIKLDTANYNSIGSFHVHPTESTFASEAASTSFTGVSGCTDCSGFAWYVKNQSAIYWVFSSSNMRATSSEIVLNYATNIFADISNPRVKCGQNPPDVNSPIAVKSQYGSCGTPNAHVAGNYDSVSVSTRGIDTYTVDYPLSNYFRISIDKNIYVNSKYYIHGNNTPYFNETSFNKVDINGLILPYVDGIILNATLQSGIYSIAVVNTTGCGAGCGDITPPGLVDYYDPNTNGSGIVNYSLAYVRFETSPIHNNSDMRVLFGLKYVINDTYKERYQDDLQWKVNIIDPNGSQITFYNILNQCKQEDTWWFDFVYNPGDWTCENVPTWNSFFVTPDSTGWLNGTYRADLVEYLVSTPSVLDSDYEVVLNESGFTGVTPGQPGVHPGGTGPDTSKYNGSWRATNDDIAVTCIYWDTWVRGIFGVQGVNNVTRLLFALFTIVAMMFIGLIASKGNFGVAVILGFFPYAFFAYLTLSSPCGEYMPLWVTIFIALIIGIKMRWFT